MYDYGNARVWALRGRLLDDATLHRLEESGSAAAFLGHLERAEDWRAVVRQVAPLAGDPAAAAAAAVEWHRSARLAPLPSWYPSPARDLVEALVLPLDRERLLAILRRRRAGEDGDHAAARVEPGAMLSGRDLAAIARAAGLPAALRVAVGRGVLAPEDAARAVGAASAGDTAGVERALGEGVERARAARCEGRGVDRARLRALLADERAGSDRVAAELREAGAGGAAELERTDTLARLDGLARLGETDRLGIGAVAGYVAAVEAQAIRIRAALARAAGGWPSALVAAYRRGARG